MRPPGATEAVLRVQHGERLGPTLVLQVPGRADARDAGADDEDIDVFAAARDCGARSHGLHFLLPMGTCRREALHAHRADLTAELECDRPCKPMMSIERRRYGALRR